MPRLAWLAVALLALPPGAGALPALAAQPPVPPAHATGLVVPLDLGTLTLTSRSDPACPTGFACQGFSVSCPGVGQDIPGFYALAEPTGPVRGVGVFFSGGGGGGWELAQVPSLAGFVTALRADGFRLVQVRWMSAGWLAAPAGEQTGFGQLACRPATVIDHLHEAFYEPLGLDPAGGVCGFCIQGNSGGSTQVGFALTHYGLETILDGVFPTGGPPHGALQKACVPLLPGDAPYAYPDGTRQFIDTGWGFYGGNGPCFRRDPLWYARFLEDSVAWGGSDYHHPATRVHLFVGQRDVGMSYPAGDYRDRLEAVGSPMVEFTTVPSTPHFVLGTAEGQAEVRAAFLWEPGS